MHGFVVSFDDLKKSQAVINALTLIFNHAVKSSYIRLCQIMQPEMDDQSSFLEEDSFNDMNTFLGEKHDIKYYSIYSQNMQAELMRI